MYAGPVVALAALAVAFWLGLARDPSILPSVLLDKPVPAFELPPLFEDYEVPGFGSDDLRGEVSVVNVFASWCIPCRVEHPLIARLAEIGDVPVYGLNYKDKPEDARDWLRKHGNSYTAIGSDMDGRVAIDWGVTGVPETFIIDRRGIIRFKYVGPLTPKSLDRTILPLIAELRKQSNRQTSDSPGQPPRAAGR